MGKCDKCGINEATVAYSENINGKVRKMNLCQNCANDILSEKEKFLDSFFNLDPFREVDKMFDNKKLLENPKEIQLRNLKSEIDELKREEGIAVMLQDYSKAAEIKKQREKLQKEAEKIIHF